MRDRNRTPRVAPKQKLMTGDDVERTTWRGASQSMMMVAWFGSLWGDAVRRQQEETKTTF